MNWISRLFGNESSGLKESDISATCVTLRKCLQDTKPATGALAKKSLGLQVSTPLMDALIEHRQFGEICKEYLEAGWRLDFTEGSERNMMEAMVHYQSPHVRE